MKRFLVVLAILAITVFAVSAAVTTHGSGNLNVYGKIGTGAVSFLVVQTNSTVIDLKSETAVQPLGAGVVLGNWTFAGSNQGSSVVYTVTYATTPLTSGTTTIPFEVLELEGSSVQSQVLGATTFTAPAGNPSIDRDIAVRLLSAVPEDAPAAINYTGSITVTLTSGS